MVPASETADDYVRQGAYHWRGVYPRWVWRYNLQMSANYAVVLAALKGAFRKPGLVVLDVGCGDGVLLHMLRARRMNPVGVDISLPALRLAVGELRRRSHHLGPVLQGTAECLPLAAACVDAVLAVEVLEHLENRDGFLREAGRVLRPGGALIITTPHRDAGGVHSAHHVSEVDEHELDALLRAYFRYVVIRGFNPELAERIYHGGGRPVKLAMKVFGRYGRNPFAITGEPPLRRRFRSLLAVCRR